MPGVGIIAEFNPLHNGHKYLLTEASKKGTVVCILSGNFVQRGDTALLEKRKRTEIALKCGADIVIELPVLWSMSTAQNFAMGAVSAALFAGCETLMFGSECGNTEKLIKASNIFSIPEYPNILKKHLSEGITFAAARERAGKELGADPDILKNPNDNLGIEYISAAKKLNAEIGFFALKRTGVSHDSKDISETVSSSFIREKVLSGKAELCRPFMPENSYDIMTHSPVSDIKKLDTAILSALRSLPKEALMSLPDISEGIENKIFSAIRLATDIDSMYNRIKVKRYTMARLRRLILAAFLGFDSDCFLKPLPYLRVLGMNKAGENYLRCQMANSPVPVILRPSDTEKLSEIGKKVFATECRATDIYTLSLSKPMECGLEYTSKIIKTE